MVVGAVEAPSGKGLLQPAKESFVIGVHTQGDVGLPTVTTEVTLPDQDANEHTDFEFRPGGLLFHRHVSREAFVRLELFHRQVSRETFYSSGVGLGQNSRMGVELAALSREEFGERLSRCGPEGVSESLAETLYLHYSELRRWNRRISLVGPVARDLVVERHYGESLEGLRFLEGNKGALVDLGSGAGFPGLVLAAARPDIRATLVEARERKWSFLESVCRKTGLACKCLNARVDTTPVEGLPLEIDWITARAVGFEDLGLSVLLPRLTPEGALLLWVGANDPEIPSTLEVRREVLFAGTRFKRILEIAKKPDFSEDR